MNHKHRRVHAFLTFQYDCFGAPLEFNGVKYSWWNDRYGKVQYFWSGTNTTSHICQCGIDKDCVDPDVKCNCDSYELQQLNDSGLWVLLSNIFRFTMNERFIRRLHNCKGCVAGEQREFWSHPLQTFFRPLHSRRVRMFWNATVPGDAKLVSGPQEDRPLFKRFLHRQSGRQA